MNIQHLESLADVVSRITGVAVRETVPDRVLQEADEVVLVDITPDELIQRLQRGQGLSAGDCAARDRRISSRPAISPRCASWRSGAPPTGSTTRWSIYLRQNAIEGPWAAAERLLVCVGPEPSSERVVRAGEPARDRPQRRLDRLVYSRARRSGGATPGTRRSRQDASVSPSGSAARRCGSRAPTIRPRSCGSRGARTSPRSCSAGRRGPFGARLLGRSLPEELMRRAGAIEVHVVPREERERRRGRGSRLKLESGGARRRGRGGARFGRLRRRRRRSC